MRGKILRGMKKTGKNEGKKRISASFMTGAVALVFLVTGYQAALFLHKASVLRILSVRDHPDTVYVIDPALAESLLSAAGEGREGYSVISDGSTDSQAEPSGSRSSGPGTSGRVLIRKESPRPVAVDRIRSEYPVLEAESFRFDPNTVSVHDLMRLGFSRKQAASIDNYRKKGGRFRRKSDFARSYVVADSVYRRLEPYIDIPLLDINRADSADFDALPGIGGYFAARMVEYRSRLGGSYSYKEQLMDIRHFDRERYDGLSDLIVIDSAGVSPYRLWSLPEDSLRLHPYIGSYAVAHGIVLFRENNPSEKWSVDALEKAGVIRPEMAAKLGKCHIASPGH